MRFGEGVHTAHVLPRVHLMEVQFSSYLLIFSECPVPHLLRSPYLSSPSTRDGFSTTFDVIMEVIFEAPLEPFASRVGREIG